MLRSSSQIREKNQPTIVSIGAAVQDVFLQGKIFSAHKNSGGEMVQQFELGTKNEIEGVVYSVGGGATNASVTFARQGLHSCYMGKIGDDVGGKLVLDVLHKEGVDTSLVGYSSKFGTGYSALLLSPDGERTILTYRGASKQYELKEDDFHASRPDWFYVSSLSGDVAALKIVIDYAQKHHIKIAINPGKGELQHLKEFKQLLSGVSLLSLNKEEMNQLFESDSSEKSIRQALEQVEYVLVTDGPKGSLASDGKKLYQAGMYDDVPVIDRAGAGDAFSSGFTAMIAKGESIESALVFASANSTSVVSKIGAKTGILHSGIKLRQMPVEVRPL